RLFRNVPAHRWTGRIHEQIAPAIVRVGGELRSSSVVVYHLGYQDRTLFQHKIERNLRILELEYESRDRDGWFFFQSGGAQLAAGRYGEAIVSLHIAIPLIGSGLMVRAH